MKINYISLMDLKDVYPLWEKGSRRFGWEFVWMKEGLLNYSGIK